jgi:small GTP-binding protein
MCRHFRFLAAKRVARKRPNQASFSFGAGALAPKFWFASTKHGAPGPSQRRGFESWNKTCQHVDKAPTKNTDDDTIFALSTAAGRAAIAVIRVSGPSARSVYSGLCPGKAIPRPRQATIRTLFEPVKAEGPSTQSTSRPNILDPSSLILFFPGPSSYTGEDILELHIHGGTAVVAAVLRCIPKVIRAGSRIRYAEPGEFTRRALLSGRLDLTQVEALEEVLSAQTEQQRRRSVTGTSGSLTARYESWREKLIAARGELEALIDFAEDQQFEDSASSLLSSVLHQVTELRRRIEIYVRNAARGDLLKNGISVTLIGSPNSGKSSLLNLIVGREAAIVSPEQGTTRDVLEIPIDLGGYLCRFLDTAGLRSAQFSATPTGNSALGAVEKEGIERAKSRALQSDVLIILLSLDEHRGPDGVSISPQVIEIANSCAAQGSRVLIAVNKIDLANGASPAKSPQIQSFKASLEALQSTHSSPIPILALSCKQASSDNPDAVSKSGFHPLMQHLISTFEQMTSPVHIAEPGSQRNGIHESLGASERQRNLLSECLSHLDDFIAQAHNNPTTEIGRTSSNFEGELGQVDVVLAAEALRSAADSLARITGRGASGDVEEVLGVVFERYVLNLSSRSRNLGETLTTVLHQILRGKVRRCLTSAVQNITKSPKRRCKSCRAFNETTEF